MEDNDEAAGIVLSNLRGRLLLVCVGDLMRQCRTNMPPTVDEILEVYKPLDRARQLAAPELAEPLGVILAPLRLILDQMEASARAALQRGDRYTVGSIEGEIDAGSVPALRSIYDWLTEHGYLED